MIKSTFDAMKVFTTFYVRGENKLDVKLLFAPMKNKLGVRPNLFFMGEMNIGHPTYFPPRK